jgi:sulfoxide reductase heme-binding subunit YedZ
MSVVDRFNRAARRVPPWPLYLLGALPVAWVYHAGLTGALGIDPVKKIEHRLGEWALWLVIAGLCVTPLRRFAGLNLLKFRRAIGLLTFFYVLAHFLTWLVFDIQLAWGQIGRDIVKRPYITAGFAAFLLLVPLAATSSDRAIRRMGAAGWRRLHRLVYPAAVLGGLHYIWLAKGFQLEPLVYTAVILALLAMRLRWTWQKAAA